MSNLPTTLRRVAQQARAYRDAETQARKQGLFGTHRHGEFATLLLLGGDGDSRRIANDLLSVATTVFDAADSADVDAFVARANSFRAE